MIFQMVFTMKAALAELALVFSFGGVDQQVTH